MIDKIITGTTTDEDVAAAQAYGPDERKKLSERLLGTLGSSCGEVVLLDDVMEDVAHALRQARPVFAAGLPVDQALGFIAKMIGQSLEELEEAGAADSDEYEKQELVLEKLNGFIEACNTSGNTQGEQAQETAHFEYRGEVGKLEALKNQAEAGIANSLSFLQRAYGEGGETEAFVKGIDHTLSIARFIGKFGSPSLFAYKHVAAPGESYREAVSPDDSEGD